MGIRRQWAQSGRQKRLGRGEKTSAEGEGDAWNKQVLWAASSQNTETQWMQVWLGQVLRRLMGAGRIGFG